jgi:hypothetical protein
MIDPKLYEFATVRQLEVLQAIDKHGSNRAAARALGIHKNVVNDALRAVEKKAALRGYSPDHDLTRPVAPGQILRGASTLYRRGEPEPVLQWIKTKADDEAREQIIKAALAALSEDVRGMAPLSKAPHSTAPDLMVVYPMGDPHFGLYSWAKETGEDFDLDTARRLTMGAVDRLVESSPAADIAVILPLGDVFHANDQTNVTPKNKNQLDVDGRFVKVLGVGIQTYRHAILRALEKHAKVVVRFVGGNHDPHAIWALAFSIAAYFDNEPRVEVDLSPADFWFYRFGSVLIGSTHGDKTKTEQLLGVMATDRAQDWGATKHRYWYTGHIHHSRVVELPGVVCESFRTLAARDAWSAGHGYRAGRDMRAIVLHRDHGEIERHRCDVGMLEA